MKLINLKEIEVGKKFAFLYASGSLLSTVIIALIFYVLAIQKTSLILMMLGWTSLGLGIALSIFIYRSNTSMYRVLPTPPQPIFDLEEIKAQLLKEIKEEQTQDTPMIKEPIKKKTTKKPIEEISEDIKPIKQEPKPIEEDDLEDTSLI